MIAAVVNKDADSITDRDKIPNSARKFYGRMEELPEKIIDTLCKRYALRVEDIARAGWVWSPEMDGGRIQMPIWTRFRHPCGHSFRTLDKRKLPKNKIVQTDPTSVLLSYYKCADSADSGVFNWGQHPLVIVEDQISALRVSKYTNSVALLGTNLSNEKVMDILKLKCRKVLLALDEDAKAMAIKYKALYQEFFPSFDIVHLKYDLKDSSDEVIKEKLFV